jgi:hypothetical protein
MTKSEILASGLPAVEKVWLIASQRGDIGTGSYGVVAELLLDGGHVYQRIGDCEQNYTVTAAGLLNLSEEWVDAFIDGFDGAVPSASLAAEPLCGHLASEEIRRRFQEKGVSLE